MKKIVSILLIVVFFFVSTELISYARFQNGYPNKEVEKKTDGLAYKKQTIEVTVTGMAKPKGNIIWTQTDTGTWVATRNNGEQVTTNTNGSGESAVPTRAMVKNKINSLDYAPENLRDGADNPFKKEYVKKLGIEDIRYIDAKSYEPQGEKPEFTKGDIFAILWTWTGYPLEYTDKIQYGWRADGAPKFNAHYHIPLEIDYKGYITETKELKVSDNATLKKGQTKQLKAEVRTQEYDMDVFTDYVDVTRRDQTEWITDKQSVVSVDPNTGMIKAEGKGTAKITAKWKSGPYYIYDYVNITVDDETPPPCKPGEPGCEKPPEEPKVECTDPAPSIAAEGRYMDPVVTAKILADQRGSEAFDVLRGIPTSESLYGNVSARNYLYQNKFVNMKGACKFTVNVEKTWSLTWDPGKKVTGPDGKETEEPDPQSEEETVTQTHTIERPYSFWVIDNLEVYQIDQATLKNYALPGGEVILRPKGYQAPIYTAQSTGNYYPPTSPGTVTAPSDSKSGGKTKPSPPNDSLKSYAENAIQKVEVTNDSLSFNNQTIINGARVPETGPTPARIPAPTQIGQDVLYSPNHVISPDKINRANTTSAGTIIYDLLPGNINGGSRQEFPIHGINTVTVHTPVVNYSSVTDDQAHNQKTKPNASRAAFILDRPFTVRIPISGQHVNYPGYGNRDYAKYIRTKQVYFPFDVYSRDRSTFYPKNTWITIPVNQIDTDFFLPVWVDEGDYTVSFRTIAENAPADYSTQPSANQDLKHHVATDVEQVEVIGRVYDFRVTDIADYNWETVFRTQKGSSSPRGTSYWTGMQDIDGAIRGNQLPYTLPIAPGKHPNPGYKNVSVKTGYHFKFDLKTKGNMFSTKDGIAITPSFFFVNKDGKGRQAVDLYYHSDKRNFIRIGSPQDQEKRYVILNERLRNVPQSELQDTASYLYNHGGAPGGISGQVFKKQFVEKITKNKTWVGRYDWMLLPSGVRTFIGPKSGLPSTVDAERANAAVQRWYGEYSIPSDVYVVKKGTDLAAYGRVKGLDEKSEIFLKKGFIVVNFNIETIQAGNLTQPHLQYIHAPLMNQWKLEGYANSYTNPYGHRFALTDGDTLFYHADQSSKRDFTSQVPH